MKPIKRMKAEIFLAFAVVLFLSIAFLSRGSQTVVQEGSLTDTSLTELNATAGELSLELMAIKTGTHFEVTDSEGNTLSIDANSEVSLILESMSQQVHMMIKESPGSTALTVTGLKTQATHYLYIDGYQNPQVITTDAAGSLTFTLDAPGPHVVWTQSKKSTVFIFNPGTNGAPCAFDNIAPPATALFGVWNAATNTCLLGMDITEPVVIANDNITLDCGIYDGDDDNSSDDRNLIGKHTITGSPSPSVNGVFILFRNNVTVKNCDVSLFTRGIFIAGSAGITLLNNTLHNNFRAGATAIFVSAYSASDNTVFENPVGLFVGFNSLNNGGVFSGNIISNSKASPVIPTGGQAIVVQDYSNFEVNGNIISDTDNVSIAVIFGNDNIDIIGNEITDVLLGIVIANSQNSDVIDNEIEKSTLEGISLESADFNVIMDNDIEESGTNGILLTSSNNNLVKGNEIEDCGGAGILEIPTPPPSSNNLLDNDIDNCPEEQEDDSSS